jgi:hypothetical protein
MQQQKAEPAKADDLHFHNLQVLPQNMAREDLIRTMRIFSRSLGVRCDHCHVQIAETPKPEFDFPNDAKPEKKIARTMIRMVRAINGDYIAKVPGENKQQVTCNTCHRGKEEPDVPPINVDQPPPAQH